MEKRHVIEGPVYPILPAFTSNDIDCEVDYGAVSHYVEFLIKHGAKTLMVTAGTSRFNLLSEQEIYSLNQTVVKSARRRAFTIAANPMTGSTDSAITFAQHAQAMGADALLVYYPERYYDDDVIVEHFEALAANSEIDLMLHAMPMRSASSQNPPTTPFSVQLCSRLVDIPNFIGMKEESGDINLRYKIATALRDRTSIILAGGSMKTYLTCHTFGVHGFLTGLGSIVPNVEENFWQMIKDGNLDAARDIVDRLETPFFDVAMSIGWHIAMKASLSLAGIFPSYERPPLHPPSREDIKSLQKILQEIGAY